MQSDPVEPPIQLAPVALPELRWEPFGEPLNQYQRSIGFRLWVPGGWLVDVSINGEDLPMFVSDPDHTWDADYAAWKESQQ